MAPSSPSTSVSPPGPLIQPARPTVILIQSPLTTGSGSNFVAADNVTATYSRVAGENASPPTYHITATLSATPLSALDNYIITNDGAEFTINKRLATWTTNPASKTYGDPDPVAVDYRQRFELRRRRQRHCNLQPCRRRERESADLSHHGHVERDTALSAGQLHHHQRWRRVHHQQASRHLDH